MYVDRGRFQLLYADGAGAPCHALALQAFAFALPVAGAGCFLLLWGVRGEQRRLAVDRGEAAPLLDIDKDTATTATANGLRVGTHAIVTVN